MDRDDSDKVDEVFDVVGCGLHWMWGPAENGGLAKSLWYYRE